jgi:hypothetical protein
MPDERIKNMTEAETPEVEGHLETRIKNRNDGENPVHAKDLGAAEDEGDGEGR